MPRRRILPLLILLAGCDDSLFGDPKDGETPAGDDFCAVQAIFDASCTGCHGPAAGPVADLDLQTDPHAAIVDQSASTVAGAVLVVPGDPEGSLLYRKSAGTQGADEGGAMPPGSGLAEDDLTVLHTWISDGAAAECDTSGDTGSGTYHPSGWAVPTAHGLAAKLQEQDCTACHGEDLTGGTVGVSCDTCHPTGWRTDCTYCHGGVDDTTGAPPEDIDDEAVTASTSFPPHHAHVAATWSQPWDCTACHLKPTDILSSGHIFVGDTSPGAADVSFSGGLSSAGTYGAGTCGSLYCHGSGQGHDGRVTRDAGAMTCGSCHASRSSGAAAWDLMSGEHDDHLEAGLSCEGCHGGTTADGIGISNPALHVNGVKDLALPATIVRTGLTCNGTCHGVTHSDRDWD